MEEKTFRRFFNTFYYLIVHLLLRFYSPIDYEINFIKRFFPLTNEVAFGRVFSCCSTSFRKGGKIMKKQCLIVLATLVIGLGSLASVQGSEIVAFVYGNTVVQDPEGDFLLRNCDSAQPSIPCSLPPNASQDLPGYLDIKKAKITQIGRGRVDLSIELYEPIPAEPPYSFVNYFWQFEGGCVDPKPGNKAAISVLWRDWGGGTMEWRANWLEITSCNPRTIAMGDEVPFKFTENGVKVQVALDDLKTAIDLDEPLIWHAGVRLVSFTHQVFISSVGVDYTPDIIEFNPAPPPYLNEPEDPATWEPR